MINANNGKTDRKAFYEKIIAVIIFSNKFNFPFQIISAKLVVFE